jgi:hypothetical protein
LLAQEFLTLENSLLKVAAADDSSWPKAAVQAWSSNVSSWDHERTSAKIAKVVGGGSILSELSRTDRPHFHSGIFFFRTDVSGVKNPIVFWPSTVQDKTIAASNTYGPTKRDERQAASAAARNRAIYFLPRRPKSRRASAPKKMSRNLVGVGVVKSLGSSSCGPVVLVHTQKSQV